MKILIVDDDRTSRAFFKRELSRGGYEILEASDGFEAIHVIHEENVDLVLLDIEMPDMDGYQVCTWLRSEQFTERLNTGVLPIVFVTSNESLESRLKGFRAGATDFLIKGFKPGALLKLINKILRPHNILEGVTALLVDDSKLVRDMVTAMLREQGVIVLAAGDGQQGYDLLMENIHEVDLVITDLEMPIMNGDELCFKIRKDLGLNELPVLFLTAVPDRTVLIDLFKSGANDYLVKPFVKEELIARLKVLLEIFQSLGDEVSERKRAQADLAQTRALVKEHKKDADRVDLANTVLHNVNNVLNSVSVSCGQMTAYLGESRLPQLVLALGLVDANRDDLPGFFSKDPKGVKLPEYFKLVSGIVQSEHNQIHEELEEMSKKVKLMKDIIETQQLMSHNTTQIGRHHLLRLVDSALAVTDTQLKNSETRVTVKIDDEVEVFVLEVEFIHLMINLIKNGTEAMADLSDKEIHIKSEMLEEGMLSLTVSDKGCGIPEENLHLVFEQGFTTKKKGHGYGLASCANSMEKMGGSICVKSEGKNKGTHFIISIPTRQESQA